MWFFFTRPEYVVMRHPAWSAVIDVLDVARREHPMMTVGALHTFLHAASNQEAFYDRSVDMKRIAEDLDLPYSTLARQTDTLGEGIGKRGGLGLIEKRLLPGSQKLKIIDFTEKGIGFLLRMLDALPTAQPEKKELQES